MYHDSIKTTYYKRFKELTPEKQFHFVTRLALWNHDTWAIQELSQQKDTFLGGVNQADWQRRMTEIQSRKPDYAHMNHSSARQTYFDANPDLYGLELSLFQAMHAHYHFDVDLSGYLPDKSIIKSYTDNLLLD